MRSCLLDEIACLVKADTVPFRITNSLADTKIIGLPGVAVFGGAFEVLDRLLFQVGY